MIPRRCGEARERESFVDKVEGDSRRTHTQASGRYIK
jgi:hypothetical protein